MTKAQATKVQGLLGLWLPTWKTQIDNIVVCKPANQYHVEALLPIGTMEIIFGKPGLERILQEYCDMSEESAAYYASLAIE